MAKVTVKIEESVIQEAMKLYRESCTRQAIESLESGLDYKISAYYKKNNDSLLSMLCDKYGSDKGEIEKQDHPYPWPSHTYADYYSSLYDHCRFGVKNVFECGLGTNNPDIASSMGVNGKPGASLRAWREYFPNSQIIGADIDRDILFSEERIKTYYLDQTNPASIFELWNEVGISDFDFMIDDGLHTFSAGVCLFENSISKLKNDGIYIIEDVNLLDLTENYKKYFDDKKYTVEYVNLFRPNAQLFHNNLIVIRKP